MLCASSSCSAWLNRSIATQSAGVVPSASTRISLGPAIMSMPTLPNTRRFALAIRRRHDHYDLADAGDLRRQRVHQHARRIGGLAARHVDADPVERRDLL